jgi:hypothetical protein
MSGQLEQFINDHRDEFDAEEPGKKIWDNIHQKIEPEVKQTTRVMRVSFMRWSAAASVVVLLGAGAWYFLVNHNNVQDNLGKTVAQKRPVHTPVKPSNDLPQADSAARITQPSVVRQTTPVKPAETKTDESTKGMESDVKKEMVYYAKIVELKHDELRKIKKDEPLLYQQFSGDVYKLDSVYLNLKRQLPKNSNREQLLEAMIQNLQLQMELLNHQLNIIKQINNSKKSAYEQAYKSA